jgi:adenylylsulfate kinase
MKTTILIMGLSGAGKTTFYEKIKNSIRPHIYLNADTIRKLFDDWDFSIEGRLRQAERMKSLRDNCTHDHVIIDMICPLKEMRDTIKPDIIFFVDRVKESKYKDTDNIFQIPTSSESSIFYTIS